MWVLFSLNQVCRLDTYPCLDYLSKNEQTSGTKDMSMVAGLVRPLEILENPGF